MNVAVFGLGYVGCVSATCLAELGQVVVGVDVNDAKVNQINSGISPIVEPQLADKLRDAVNDGRLSATTSPEQATKDCDVALICVGTPSAENGSIDHRQLLQVAHQIGNCLPAGRRPVIAVRSTVMPDVVLHGILPALEAAGARAGEDFSLCVNPEFLREGTAVRDFQCPPMTLIGQLDDKGGAWLARLYESIRAPLVRTDLKTASLIKYASNAFHALKIVFANELGVLCESLGADSHAVMDVFCQDTKLNVSTAYLRPGFAFGGSCLPKDLRAVLYRARHADADLPMLDAIIRSNELHISRALKAITRSGKRRIGMVGLSFKSNTDDLRESPLVTVVEQLLGRGYQVRVFDAEVMMSRVFGRNKEFIDRTIPHITSLMTASLDDLIAESEVLVVGKRFDGFDVALERARVDEQIVVDLARVWPGSVSQVADRPVVRIN